MLFRGSVGVLFACAVLNGSAGASPIDVSRVSPPTTAGALAEGAFTPPPKAFFPFCAKFARQCVRTGGDGPVTLDQKHWSELVAVNRRVNSRIKPKAEPAGVDIWTLGAREGDCDAYALEKRKELMDLGWSSSALQLTVVYVASGEAHLVLTARTDGGEFVLDNLRAEVLGVESVGYRFVMRQSTIHPRLWVSVDRVEARHTTVASAEPASQGPAHAPSIDVAVGEQLLGGSKHDPEVKPN
jgi:predicted transglutaminase-like cysteine proteinase